MADFYGQCATLYPITRVHRRFWPTCPTCRANPFLCPHDQDWDALAQFVDGLDVAVVLHDWLIGQGASVRLAKPAQPVKEGPSLIARIKARLRIEDVAYRLTELTGFKNLKGRCPFHDDSSPSFYVYPETQSFYCFGCQVGGDVITLAKLAESRGLSIG